MTGIKKIAFLFPGQGAQYPGMARDFVENFPEARLVLDQANDVLGRNLSSIILEGPKELLLETRNSQSGIYVASLAILKVLQTQFPTLRPSICAGFSLGEFTAITAAEKLDFEEGLRLVEVRGELMNKACEETKGTMVVVVGLESTLVEWIVKELNLPNDLWVADYTCPEEVVISGTLKGIEIGSTVLKEKGANLIIPLSVHGAFHSGLMGSAEEKLRDHINKAKFKNSSIDIVMNITDDFAKSIDEIRRNLIKQMTSPVRWEQSIRKMGAAGVDLFIEIGCGKTLTRFNKRIGLPIPSIGIEKLSELDRLAKEFQ